MYTIHLGYSGYPYGNATIQRIRLTFKSLEFSGKKSIILNKRSIHDNETIKRVGRYDNLVYINLSHFVKRPKSFLARNYNKFSGFFSELVFLFKMRKKIDSAIFYSDSFSSLVYYKVLSKIFGFKLILQYVEYWSALVGREKLNYKINDFLFDNYCTWFGDGIIVISEFLRDIVNKQRKSFPTLKIPAICDFSIITPRTEFVGNQYILYTAGITYLDIIEFVIEVFVKLKQNGVYSGKLLLAIGGKDFGMLDSIVDACMYKNDIIYKKNVPHTELLNLYLDADVLLIPLRNSIQDIARFPHKVGEYSAAGRPIVSTNVGELKYYFRDGVSAILTNEFSVDEFYFKISELLGSIEALNAIGSAGHKVGLQSFDYKGLSASLSKFLAEI